MFLDRGSRTGKSWRIFGYSEDFSCEKPQPCASRQLHRPMNGLRRTILRRRLCRPPADMFRIGDVETEFPRPHARVVKTLSERFPVNAELQGQFEVDAPWIHTGVALAAEG